MLHEILATGSYRSYGGFIYLPPGCLIAATQWYDTGAKVAAVATSNKNNGLRGYVSYGSPLEHIRHLRRPKGPNK